MTQRSKIWGSRRRFLKGLSKAGMSASMLNTTLASAGLLWARSAFAIDEQEPALRYILTHMPDGGGARANTWHANGFGTNFTLSDATAEFESQKHNMLFFDQITGVGGHGDRKSYITNGAFDSIDHYLAKTIGADAPYSWLGASLAGIGRYSVAQDKEVNPDTNPFSIYRRFFGTGEAGVSIDGVDLKTAQYLSVLNLNRELIQDIKPKLGSNQKIRFESIENAIDETEQSIQKLKDSQTGSCANPAWGGAGIEETIALADGDLRCDILIDVIALAMKCDMLRVASLSVDRTDVIPGVDINIHDSAHEELATRANAGRSWLNSKIVRLMNQLENATDIDGNSLLHNTIIHHVSDYGNGKLHSNIRAPIFLAGGGKGKLRTGLNFDGSGQSYFDIFDTVADIAGVINEPDYPQYGNGVISSLIL